MHYAQIDQFLQTLKAETQSLIQSLSAVQHYPRGTILLREGEHARKTDHILDDTVRRFSSGKGRIATSEFYFTNHFAAKQQPRER